MDRRARRRAIAKPKARDGRGLILLFVLAVALLVVALTLLLNTPHLDYHPQLLR